MCIGCNPIIAKPCGSNIESSQSMVYLGGVISADGQCTSEINRRIGLASSEFSSLQKVWSHANLSVRKKIAIYQSLIVPKLMYALEGIWLNQGQRRRLDSFHNGCIRRIVKVQHAYYSRISNEDVLKAAHSTPLSLLLLRSQLISFARIASLDHHHLVRDLIFQADDTLALRESTFLKKQGRPRLSWASELLKISFRISGSAPNLQSLLRGFSLSPRAWISAIDSYLHSSDSID